MRYLVTHSASGAVEVVDTFQAALAIAAGMIGEREARGVWAEHDLFIGGDTPETEFAIEPVTLQ